MIQHNWRRSRIDRSRLYNDPGVLRSRGQALIETALVLPLILLVLFGIISYGLYINAMSTVQQAVRVGARAASIGDTLGCPGDSATNQLASGNPPTVYGVVDDQINHDQPWLTTRIGSSPIPVISYAAIVGNQQNTQQNNILLTVAYPYRPLLSIPGLLPTQLEISETYQMMVETPQPPGATTTTEPTGSPYDETTKWTTPPPPTTNITYLVQPGGC